jgi:osmotically-inducible protein OsmY
MKLAHLFATVLAAIMISLVTGCSPSPTREQPGEYIDDALITSKVKAAFAADPEVKATEVKVVTYKGIVQLSGFVDTAEMAQRAAEIARKVKGVKNVKNDIVVKPKSTS